MSLEASSIVGATSELKACTWLIEMGYQVLRNVCATGSVDLVTIDKEGNVTLLDVKTANFRVDKNSYNYGRLTNEQNKLGVKLFLVSDTFIGFEEDLPMKRRNPSKQCLNCSKPLQGLQVFYCHNPCTKMVQERKVKLKKSYPPKFNKNPDRKCLVCSTELTGKQQYFCTKKCERGVYHDYKWAREAVLNNPTVFKCNELPSVINALLEKYSEKV